MCEPLGLNLKLSTSTGKVVTCLASPPSGRIVQICREPERLETNAMVRLSGDQVGEGLLNPPAFVRWRGCDPSSATSHRLVVVLFASASQDRSVNATQRPSGDGTGSPTRSIRTMSWTPNGCGSDSRGAAEGVGEMSSSACAGGITPAL